MKFSPTMLDVLSRATVSISGHVMVFASDRRTRKALIARGATLGYGWNIRLDLPLTIVAVREADLRFANGPIARPERGFDSGYSDERTAYGWHCVRKGTHTAALGRISGWGATCSGWRFCPKGAS